MWRRTLWYAMMVFGIGWMVVLLWFVFASAEGPARGPGGQVMWDANTEPDLEGYRVYFGPTPTTVEQVREVRVPDHALQYGSVGLTPGQWYVAVTAFDLSGNESEKAGPMPFVYDPVAPTVPRGTIISEIKRGLQDICLALGLSPTACRVEIKATVVIP